MERKQLMIGALAEESSALDLGPEHPSRAGLVVLDLDIEAEQVTAARLGIGFSHRAAEKLFEVRDYRQILMLADRHDWQAPFSGELGVALTCEQLLGLTPPPRATIVRTLLAEVARVHSHLGFLTWIPHRLAHHELAAGVRAVRDELREVMLQLTGNRLHPMANRLGGLACDPDAAWLGLLARTLTRADELAQKLASATADHLAGSEGAAERGTGIADRAVIDQFGMSGPVARTAGLARDLRRDPGYLSYPSLDFGTALPVHGPDAWGRLLTLIDEVSQSVRLAEQLIERVEQTPGPVGVKLSKIIKLPDAQTWLSIEAPWGIAGYHLVSRGQTTVWRLKLRTPTMANVSALERVLVGVRPDRVGLVIASLGWTIGDLDK